MSIVQGVLAFSKGQRNWMQDALRRLALAARLGQSDMAELLNMLKAEHGLPVGEPAVAPVPLAEEHLNALGPGGEPVVLEELAGVKHTGRLAGGQSLRFAIDGITLVYGDNASGKSSYSRILKKLCRVREGGEEDLLPDAYQAIRPGPAEATIRYRVGDISSGPTQWKDGTAPPAELRRISVFDAKASRLYVDKENRIDFLPFGLDLLPRLAGVCQALARSLESEMWPIETRCQTALVALPVGTEGAALAGMLTRHTPVSQLPSDDRLRKAGEWNDSRAARLAELELQLGQDTSALSTLVQRARGAALAARARIAELAVAVVDASMATLREAVSARTNAREMARLTASALFEDEPLGGVGGSPWRLMFEHARQYSAHAYPGETFPVARPGARCVLCQQELDADAARRLIGFDGFVRSAAETSAKNADEVVEQIRRSLQDLRPSDPEEEARPLSGFDGADEQLRDDVRTFLSALNDRRAEALRYASGEVAKLFLEPLPEDPTERLAVAAAQYKQCLIELAALQSEKDVRQRLERERDELFAARSLNENLAVCIARRADLLTLDKLNRCKSDCGTTAISLANTDLRRRFLSQDFKDLLDDELRYFDISDLPLKVGDRSDHGVSYVEVGLDSPLGATNSDILSEGERKALALACFFAEIRNTTQFCGMIFDDPVSSLDHLRRRRVAERIIREALSVNGRAGRQVIVFTHDLVFYHELQDAAAQATPPVPVATHEIVRSAQVGLGTVREKSEPWFVRKVNARFPGLEQGLKVLKNMPDQSGEEYRKATVAFYTDLRESWERLVEDDLLSGTVTRFGGEVKTQSLREVVVEDEDHRKVFVGMKRASQWSGHDQARARQNTPPESDVAEADLKDLMAFHKTVRGRKNEIKSRREKLEEPPPGTLV